MTQPLIPYDLFFSCASLLCVLGMAAWLIHEAVAAYRHRSRRNVLRKPVDQCVASRHEAMWVGRR